MVAGGTLPAGELCSQLQAAGEQIVKVLHAIVHQVPLGAVADPSAEGVAVTQTFPGIKISERGR